MKLSILKNKLRKLNSLIIAFSGGVDSAFLLAVAKKTIKGELVAITANSKIRDKLETQNAIKIAKEIGVKHIIINTKEMENPLFFKNTKKKMLLLQKRIVFTDKKNCKKIRHKKYSLR